MNARLLALALAGFVVFGAACGNDDPNADNDNGPAADVRGVWVGTYASDLTDRQGTLCFRFEQDHRELTGAVVFEGEEPVQIGGRIANERMSFVWTLPAEPSPASTEMRFVTGGTFSGDVAGETASGLWNSLNSDRGTWSAQRDVAATCG